MLIMIFIEVSRLAIMKDMVPRNFVKLSSFYDKITLDTGKNKTNL
jgi:hypothetical protein